MVFYKFSIWIDFFFFVIVLFQDVRSCTWYLNEKRYMQDIYEKNMNEKLLLFRILAKKPSSSCQPLGKPFIFMKESCFGIGAERLFFKKWKKNKQEIWRIFTKKEIWRMRIGKNTFHIDFNRGSLLRKTSSLFIVIINLI